MRGVGDRYRWAWKGTDFANGTFQGAVHGLALLLQHSLLPKGMSEQALLARIEQAIDGIAAITRPNGSLDEILPFESSYCVTALVLFDALSALEILKSRLPNAQRHLATLTPLARFLARSAESHGVITNHLAVAAAALTLWHKATGEAVIDARDAVLRTILVHHSSEGWFREYEGADPGYQTLALDYLVALDTAEPALQLHKKLQQTCHFLTHCAHPDGSFGGLYGSRNTRFLYPAGIEALATGSPDAAALAGFARRAHAEQTIVGLAMMDDANLIPMFNSFCRAAVVSAQPMASPSTLPCDGPPLQQHFPQAGWVVTRTNDAYSIVNWRKGAVSFFSPERTMIDGGAAARDERGRWYTSQTAGEGATLVSADDAAIVIDTSLQRYHVQYPSPLQMVVLRLLCLTVMRVPALNACIKRLLVWLLIARKPSARHTLRRTIRLQPHFAIEDAWQRNPDQLQPTPCAFQAIHMASQGYWQRGDTQ